MASETGKSANCDPTRRRELQGFLTRHGPCLARQGSVQCFYRQRGRARCGPYYRVIVRADGRQRTFYLGRNAELVAFARAELEQLQRVRREQLHCQQRLNAGRELLRKMRAQIRDQLVGSVLKLKGWELRGMRAFRAHEIGAHK